MARVKKLLRPGARTVRSGQQVCTAPVRSGQVRSGLHSSGQVRSGPVRSAQFRSGPVRSSQVCTVPVRSGQLQSYEVYLILQHRSILNPWTCDPAHLFCWLQQALPASLLSNQVMPLRPAVSCWPRLAGGVRLSGFLYDPFYHTIYKNVIRLVTNYCQPTNF